MLSCLNGDECSGARLGFLRPNDGEFRYGFGSVGSGWVVRCEPRPVFGFRKLTRDTPNLIADLESKQNFGTYMGFQTKSVLYTVLSLNLGFSPPPPSQKYRGLSDRWLANPNLKIYVTFGGQNMFARFVPGKASFGRFHIHSLKSLSEACSMLSNTNRIVDRQNALNKSVVPQQLPIISLALLPMHVLVREKSCGNLPKYAFKAFLHHESAI